MEGYSYILFLIKMEGMLIIIALFLLHVLYLVQLQPDAFVSDEKNNYQNWQMLLDNMDIDKDVLQYVDLYETVKHQH